MTPRYEVRRTDSRIDSTRERQTTVLTTLRPMPTSTATIEVADLVREVLARLPDVTVDLVAPVAIDLPTAVLLQRAPEARRRLADEAPDKDDDTEEEEEEDDADDDDDDDDWDADDDDDDDDWDEDDDEEDDDGEEDEDEDGDAAPKPARKPRPARPVRPTRSTRPAVPAIPEPARRRR